MTKILYGEQNTKKIVNFTFFYSSIQANLPNKYLEHEQTLYIIISFSKKIIQVGLQRLSCNGSFTDAEKYTLNL